VASSTEDHSNLAKGGITVASPLNSSFVFARWLHRTDGLAQFAIACLGWGFDPVKFPLPSKVREPHITQCVIGPRRCILPNGS